jgi:hypothetical protein
MIKFSIVLTVIISTFPKLCYSQDKFIDIEFSPLILDMGNSPFKEFKGFKINMPIYFKES